MTVWSSHPIESSIEVMSDIVEPEYLPGVDWDAIEVDEAPPSQDPPLQQVEVQDDDDADE